MKRSGAGYWLITLSVALLGWSNLAAQAVDGTVPQKEREDLAAAAQVRKPVEQKLLETYGKLPLSFEANRDQTDRRVRFLARGFGYTLFLRSTDAVLVLRHSDTATALRMRLVGGNRKPDVSGLDQLPGRNNYFIGKDPKKWRTSIPTYAKVEYRNVYPGVNLVYYGNQGQLEYDFVVRPGADPQAIKVAFAGIDRLRVDASGDLVLTTASGDLRLRKPLVYQQSEGNRKPIPASYVINKRGRLVGFELGEYDAARPLIIDPVLAYSTFLGASGTTAGVGIAVDSAGNAYVTGVTSSANFPTTPGVFATNFKGGDLDAFVTKFNTTGSALSYSTFLGGSGIELSAYIAVDSAGNAYVTGGTSSTDFPTTAGAFGPTFRGGFEDAFVTKLNATGSALSYSTFLGGSGDDEAGGIAVDSAANAYVTGQTNSGDFPTPPGAFDHTFHGGVVDAFVTKLNATGSALSYSTFLGGNGNEFGSGIVVDSAGNAYVTGQTDSGDFPTTPGALYRTFRGGFEDAFVTKLNATGSALSYSTFLGGSGLDQGIGIAVDSAGNAYVTGATNSGNFPTTPGAFHTAFNGGDLDAFVVKLNATGSALIYSTFLGISSRDEGLGIAVDSAGNAYVTGATGSFDADAFVTKLNATGSALAYSTFLGGSGFDAAVGIAVDSAGNAYVTGQTNSPDFPTTAGAFDTTFSGDFDGFVAKITGVVDFADFDVEKLEIERKEGQFEIEGTFTLAAASNGINPATEEVTLKIGTFSVTIPAGSFRQESKGRFKFEGVVAGVQLEIEIRSRGGNKFEFTAQGEGANLTGTANPVTVGLTIGNDAGSTTFTPKRD